MQKKRIIKKIALLIACVAVGSFLYSRTQIDYGEYLLKSTYDNSENNQKVEQQVSAGIVFPKYYEKQVDESLSFQVEVILEEGFDAKSVYNGTAIRYCIDQNAIYKRFFEDDIEIRRTDIDNYRDNESMKYIPYTLYESTAALCSMSEFDFVYSSQRMNYIYQVADLNREQNLQAYKLWDYSQTNDLDFLNRENSKQEIYNLLDELCLDSTYAHIQYVFSMDLDTMKQAEKKGLELGNISIKEMNEEWSKQKDEGYYYFITQSYCNIPIYPFKTVQQNEEFAAPLKIMQTESGYNLINLRRWFSIEESKEELKLLPFEEIMGVIEMKYSGLLNTNPLVVKQAKLYYFALPETQMEYVLVPIWVCVIEETNQEYGNVQKVFVPINAVTGEVMIMLE